MRRRALLIALIAVAAVPIAAQVPAGWKMRGDDHGAIHWDAARTVEGVYSVKATFTLMKPGDTATHYGLIFGGTDLEGTTPTYVSFTIAQDGTFQILHRAGSDVHEMDKSLHFSIRKPDASGKSTNTLEVQVAPTAVSYLINGMVVDATPTRAGTGSYTETEKTNGVVGIRIDNRIDVQVGGFEIKSPFTPPERGQ
jgi:hypothetical protein